MLSHLHDQHGAAGSAYCSCMSCRTDCISETGIQQKLVKGGFAIAQPQTIAFGHSSHAIDFGAHTNFAHPGTSSQPEATDIQDFLFGDGDPNPMDSGWYNLIHPDVQPAQETISGPQETITESADDVPINTELSGRFGKGGSRASGPAPVTQGHSVCPPSVATAVLGGSDFLGGVLDLEPIDAFGDATTMLDLHQESLYWANREYDLMEGMDTEGGGGDSARLWSAGQNN